MAAGGGCLAAGADGAAPLVELRGTDFQGGAQAHFGASFYGRQGVNYVYGQPTGPAATMTATLKLEGTSDAPLFLFLEAMDDDAPSQCHVRVTLNGRELYRGPSGFPDAEWLCRRFPIPPGVLQPGTNELAIVNQEPHGGLGAPPWFMVARCALAGAGYHLSPLVSPSLVVRLPTKVRAFPEPLPPGRSEPGFKFRGTKGWAWTPEQYLEEIPILAGFKMNFLMNCYLSLFTTTPAGGWKNEWWKPLPAEKKEAYARVIRACREQGITFCFAVHPQLASPRPLNPNRAEDIDQFYQHYAWAQSQGVRWFSVSLDDVSWGTQGPAVGGAEHARFVNTVFERLRRKDPGAQLVFCPGPYWGDGTNPQHRPYLEALGRDLHPDVYVFWTGDSVTTPHITRQAAQSYKSIVKHRLFLWDNYPVNDGHPTLHLGPVRGRASDLCEVIDGYLSNPMATQNQINRLPLATCADYAYNPWAYDPARSMGQAILHLAGTEAQRQVLVDLVEAYPGFLVTGGSTGSNPVRAKFGALLAAPETRPAAQDFLRRVEALAARLAREFPDQFRAARKTVESDAAWMTQKLKDQR